MNRPAIFIADASDTARMNERNGERNSNSRYTRTWQEDRAVAAGSPCASMGCRERKVRTPQGSVPDNVRDAGFKARGRLVPQKKYRLGYPSAFGLEGFRKGSTGLPGRPVLPG